MKPCVIKQGDYLDRLAHALDLDAEEVWSDPKNAEIENLRDPNMLHPGDILYVPDRQRQWLPFEVGAEPLFIAKLHSWTMMRSTPMPL